MLSRPRWQPATEWSLRQSSPRSRPPTCPRPPRWARPSRRLARCPRRPLCGRLLVSRSCGVAASCRSTCCCVLQAMLDVSSQLAAPPAKAHAPQPCLPPLRPCPAGLQPLKLPPPPGAKGSPIKAVYATTQPGGASKLPAPPPPGHAAAAPAGAPPPAPEQPPSRIPRAPWGAPAAPPAAAESESVASVSSGPTDGRGSEQGHAALPPPPMMGRPPMPPGGAPRALQFGAPPGTGDAAGGPAVPAFGAPRPAAFVPQAPGSEHSRPQSQPGSATSASAAAAGPTPFQPGLPGAGSMPGGSQRACGGHWGLANWACA